MATTPEGKVKEACKRKLKRMGAYFFMPVSNGMGAHGIPDIICCLPVEITEDMVGMRLGVFAGVETKAPGKLKNVTPLQEKNLKEINDAGGFGDVIDNANDLGKRWPTLWTKEEEKEWLMK